MDFLIPESAATRLADMLFDVVFLKGVVVSVVAALLATGMRRTSAAGRAAVWTAAVFGLVGLSATMVPWLWNVGLPQIWTVELAPFPQLLYERRVPGIEVHGEHASVAAWLGVIWAVGGILLAVRFGVALARTRGITRRARVVREAALDARVQRALRTSGLPAATRVLLTDELQVPVTWGLRRPVILLPVAARGWRENVLDAVLRHEAAHVLRRDYLTLVGLELARAVHWPNPLVWYLARRARIEQERACDDVALGREITPAEYARHLVSVARTAIVPSAVLAMVRRSGLWDRVRDVMRPDADRRPASRRTVTMAFVIVAAVALQVSLSSLWVCPTPEAAVAHDILSPGIITS